MVDVEVAVEAGEGLVVRAVGMAVRGVGMVVDVVEVELVVDMVGIIGSVAMMRTPMVSQVEGTANLRREIGMFLKGVEAMEGLVVPSVADAVVALAMERMLKGNVLGGLLTVAVELDVGQYSSILLVVHASCLSVMAAFSFFVFNGVSY